MRILSDSDFEQILSAAITAPSGGNMQPWLIRRDGDAVGLSVNHARSHNLLDVQAAAAIFSLGMLAENILITAASLGYVCTLDSSTDYQHPTGNLVVTVIFTDRTEPDDSVSRLSLAVKQRYTNRRLHTGKPYPDDKIASLAVHFQDTDCKVSFVSKQASKCRLFEILASNDILRLRNAGTLEQLIREIRWTEQQTKETRDGIDLKTLELPKGGELFLKLLSRRPALAHSLPTFFLKQFSRLPILRSSHLGLVSLERTYSNISMFHAGRHTQRLWLKSTIEEIGFHPYTVITFNHLRILLAKGEGFSKPELATIRQGAEALCQIFGLPKTALPVFVFRLARATAPTKRSLRLPPDSFLI
jgi:hypothetical protein